MRQSIKQFVKIVARTLPISEPVYEFGSLQVAGQEKFADLRSLFSGRKYVGSDVQKGQGVDIILDLHDIKLPADSVGTALVLDTLEHVEYPQKAMEEVYRILKPDGMVVISSVMNFPIHDYPHDYWRFTPEAFKSLLKPFASSHVDFAGEVNFPHIIIGVGMKGVVSEEVLKKFREKIAKWKEEQRFETLARMSFPPIVLNVYRKVRNTWQRRKK